MPLYDIMCTSCKIEVNDVLATWERLQEILAAPCPICERTSLQLDYSTLGAVFIPTPGTPEYERRVMQNRFADRNRRLDALPDEQRKKMATFFNKYGVNKTAPSGYTSPPKGKANSQD